MFQQLKYFEEQDYLDLNRHVIEDGIWIKNKRTGVRCKTIDRCMFLYDASQGHLPVVTTRYGPYKTAIAEMLGYLRGYNSAAQFRAIGCKTWDANANKTKAWLANPHRKGEDDMGRPYGSQGRDWRGPEGQSIDQLRKVYENLKNGIDDRGEIVTYWNPGEFDRSCLRPCMHTFNFTLIDGELSLNCFQRSNDLPLGTVANMVQAVIFLQLMAQITGNKPKDVLHVLVNCHIYENQLDLMRDVQLERKPFPMPKIKINPNIKTLEDLETWVTTDDFELVGYEHHEQIHYPFSE
ncbi:thymidylate synthase [Neptuniibacter sp. QD37_11]|uniref:thymidylate synthase n=1 Tax=Neptuniibacter sp. QD37_11 TaxID=3398209 RepID=UPI0039F492CA